MSIERQLKVDLIHVRFGRAANAKKPTHVVEMYQKATFNGRDKASWRTY